MSRDTLSSIVLLNPFFVIAYAERVTRHLRDAIARLNLANGAAVSLADKRVKGGEERGAVIGVRGGVTRRKLSKNNESENEGESESD